MKPIYLDANASCPPIIQAKKALIKNLKNYGNPSSPHIFGRIQRAKLDDARLLIAQALGGHEKDLIFTSGASEANRFLVEAIIVTVQKKNKKPTVVMSPFEHPSLTKPLYRAAELGFIKLAILKLNKERLLLNYKLLSQADIVFATQAHNETGIIIDWSNIINICTHKTILISDSSQGFSRLSKLPSRIDAIVVSGHKMGAFPGIGALLLRNNAKQLTAEWLGSEQENGLRPGTEALGLIEAFSAAAKIIDLQRKKHQQISILRDKMEQELLKIWLNAKIIGKHEKRLPNTSSILVQNIDGEALRIAIDAQKICVGFGSACSSLSPEPSPALLAMGLNPAQTRATMRISLHCKTSENDIFTAIERIKLMTLN